MASVCDVRNYIIAPRGGSSYWYWDKQLKGLFIGSFASVTDFYELNTGSIIDVVESGGSVDIVLKGNATIPITYVTLYSTSGDGFNKLLSAKVVGGTLTVKMYSVNAKETTTLVFTMQTATNDSPAIAITPCFNNYQIADNIVINSWCDGFTLNEIITGSGVANLVQTFNSVTCGYSAPIGPFRFSEEKTIEYRACVLSNPVYVCWKNYIGGWEYWMFDKTQIESFDTETLGYFIGDYTTIADTTNPKSERGKTGRSRILLGTNNLGDQQKQGLKGLLLSHKVYILNQDNTINRQIYITPGTFLMRVTDTIEFEITDVDINTPRN